MTSQTDRSQYECNPLIAIFDPPIQRTASGPLSGKRVAVKDNFDIEGCVTGGGSPVWAQTHAPTVRNSLAVDQVLNAGGTIVGKTHMDELAYSLMGMNAHYGTPRNSVAPDRAPGGSSSGSAAAVAAGLCDVAIGSDTGGSVRIPASFCGLFGLRTTHGLLSDEGLLPLAPSFDTIGFFARDTSSLSAIAEAFGIVPREQPLRAILPEDVWPMATSQTQAVLDDAVGAITGGGTIEHVALVDGDIAEWRQVFQTIQAWEIWKVFGNWILEHRPAFGPGVRERFTMASRVTAEEFAAASARRSAIRDRIFDMLDKDAVLIMPTAPGPAPLLAASGEEIDRYRSAALSLLCIAGLAGLPQLTIPATRIDGAPVGLSLVGAPGSDGALLAMAASLIR